MTDAPAQNEARGVEAPLDWSDPNVGHLVGLLVREGKYSGVWFADNLINAATWLEDARHRLAALPASRDEGWPFDATFALGDTVQKKGRAAWRGKVVGWYRTDLTPLGHAVESAFEPGSVQIYPASALLAWDAAPPSEGDRDAG